MPMNGWQDVKATSSRVGDLVCLKPNEALSQHQQDVCVKWLVVDGLGASVMIGNRRKQKVHHQYMNMVEQRTFMPSKTWTIVEAQACQTRG